MGIKVEGASGIHHPYKKINETACLFIFYVFLVVQTCTLYVNKRSELIIYMSMMLAALFLSGWILLWDLFGTDFRSIPFRINFRPVFLFPFISASYYEYSYTGLLYRPIDRAARTIDPAQVNRYHRETDHSPPA